MTDLLLNQKQYTNKALNNATKNLVSLLNGTVKNMYKIAHIIADVDAKKTYADDGFKNVAEWCENAVGMKKTSCYDFLRVGREYINEKNDGTVLKRDNHNDFTVTQIAVLTKLGKEKVEKLVDDEEVTAEMSVRDLKKKVKGILKEENPETESDGNGDNDTIDSTATEIANCDLSIEIHHFTDNTVTINGTSYVLNTPADVNTLVSDITQQITALYELINTAGESGEDDD